MRSFAFCLLVLSLADQGDGQDGGGSGGVAAASPVDSSPNTPKKPSFKDTAKSLPKKGSPSAIDGKKDSKSPTQKKDDASNKGKKSSFPLLSQSDKARQASKNAQKRPGSPPPDVVPSKARRLLGVKEKNTGNADKGAIKEDPKDEPILEKDVQADEMNDISFSLDFPTASAFDLLFAKDMKFFGSSKGIKECDWRTVHIAGIGSPSADAPSGSGAAAGSSAGSSAGATAGSSAGAAADAKGKKGKSLWSKLRGIPRVLGLKRSLDFKHQKVEVKSVSLRQEDSKVTVEVSGHCLKTNKKSKAEEKKAVVLTFVGGHTPSESDKPRDIKLNSVDLPPNAAHINVGKNKTILYLNSRDGLQTSLAVDIQKKTFDRA
ncbi:MAG: hypothetical protein KVP17_003137 [Porospora cf. gigantea B]|nr:MAG: hypothetical protein KVP17_003137 [Porospora cf. gigantea B]